MGSGAGIQAVGNGVADIGAASEWKTSWVTQFPNLKQYQIGMGAISVITNKAHPGVTANGQTYGLNITELKSAYDPMTTGLNMSGIAGVTDYVNGVTFVTRADGSGTADNFYQQYLGLSATSTSFNKTIAGINGTAVNGNAAVVSTVGSTSYAVGFADYGDSVANINGGSASIIILPVQDSAGTTYALQQFDGVGGTATTANFNTIRGAAKYIYQTSVEKGQTPSQSGTTAYPITLIRGLYYATNGAPSSTVQSFINFMTAQPYDQNTKTNIFQETNNFCVADIA